VIFCIVSIRMPKTILEANASTSSGPFTESVAHLLATLDLRAKSLVVTVFGDAILPHGGTVWLGSLIDLMAPFGLGERIMRTAVFRLVKDDWLYSTPHGRRSLYGVTEIGRRRFSAAHRRIYAPPRRLWSGEWHLVFIHCCDLDPERRESLRHELIWQGFGQVSTGVLAHPTADQEALDRVLDEFGVVDQVAVMRASDERTGAITPLRYMVGRCWDLEKLAEDYSGFIAHFEPVLKLLEGPARPSPQEAFVLRTLLIHDYRRVLLRDPMLPEEVLPPNWSGATARLLCRNIYRHVQEAAEHHLMSALETAEGPLPAATPYFYNRFGGIAAGE
jgi:phenylacetic acid degradation operon negative regulatory protein